MPGCDLLDRRVRAVVLFDHLLGLVPTADAVSEVAAVIAAQELGSVRLAKHVRVQVFAAKLLRRNADGTFKQVESFLPMNLRWSHAQQGSRAPEIFAEGISPEMGKHCDLGRVIDPAHHANLGEELQGLEAGESILALDLEVPPNTKSHLVPPGVYQLQLRVAAANCLPVTKVIELTITGKWFSDQKQMFSDGLGIKVIDQ